MGLFSFHTSFLWDIKIYFVLTNIHAQLLFTSFMTVDLVPLHTVQSADISFRKCHGENPVASCVKPTPALRLGSTKT